MSLLELNGLMEASIIKRPSKHIKTPYVADIQLIDNSTEEEYLAHTAALGCCGLADKGASVLLALMPIPKSKNTKQKCKFRVYLSLVREKKGETLHEIIVGIHPKLAEDLTENALTKNFLSSLQNVKSWKREIKIFVEGKVDSRFDFAGIDASGCPFILEVKNVPLADYEDITAKDRKKITHNFADRNYDSKVAYFPDGYRKSSKDPVSPRALKHIRELTLIKKESKTRCILCFVIQRNDVNRFTPSIIDPQYREAIQIGLAAGVEIITMVVEWNKEGVAKFIRDDLPIVF